jgi:hypothetical protein
MSHYDEWIKKMWYLYTMEFYSAIKTNEISSFEGKWMEPQNIIFFFFYLFLLLFICAYKAWFISPPGPQPLPAEHHLK